MALNTSQSEVGQLREVWATAKKTCLIDFEAVLKETSHKDLTMENRVCVCVCKLDDIHTDTLLYGSI